MTHFGNTSPARRRAAPARWAPGKGGAGERAGCSGRGSASTRPNTEGKGRRARVGAGQRGEEKGERGYRSPRGAERGAGGETDRERNNKKEKPRAPGRAELRTASAAGVGSGLYFMLFWPSVRVQNTSGAAARPCRAERPEQKWRQKPPARPPTFRLLLLPHRSRPGSGCTPPHAARPVSRTVSHRNHHRQRRADPPGSTRYGGRPEALGKAAGSHKGPAARSGAAQLQRASSGRGGKERPGPSECSCRPRSEQNEPTKERVAPSRGRAPSGAGRDVPARPGSAPGGRRSVSRRPPPLRPCPPRPAARTQCPGPPSCRQPPLGSGEGGGGEGGSPF